MNVYRFSLSQTRNHCLVAATNIPQALAKYTKMQRGWIRESQAKEAQIRKEHGAKPYYRVSPKTELAQRLAQISSIEMIESTLIIV